MNRRGKPRPNAGPRTTRMRGGQVDKALYTEGVYGNARFTHAVTSLVGCNVEVIVKNGGKYEGVMRTFSPKMEIVLECVHKIDDTVNNMVNTTPSKDQIIDKVVFKTQDILMLTALNVDMEYAYKDSFTDSAISKFNGQVGEKELEPWEAEGPLCELGALEGDSANGWDANDMFRTNAEVFNVKTSYDDSLTQYTTPLERKNTPEFRQRQAEAARLAAEIESSDQYKAHIALEDTGSDEEDKFSAVVRPGESNHSGSKSFRYVPPHRRSGPQTRGNRGGPSPTQVATQQQQQQKPSTPTEETQPKMNGEKEEKKTEVDTVSKTNNTEVSPQLPVEETSPGGTTSLPAPLPQSEKSAVKMDRRTNPTNQKARQDQIKELKEFSTNFKLSDKDHSKEETGQQASPEKDKSSETSKAAPSDDKKSETATPENKDDTVKKSTLNPNAKEFVFNPNAKPFQPKQAPTPPRPNSQSPLIQTPVFQQPMYQQFMPANVAMSQMGMAGMPQQPMLQPGQQQRFVKRAEVSVNPRPNFSSQAAAANAVTGQPLMAQPGPNQATQFLPAGVYPVQPMVHQGMVNPYPQQVISMSNHNTGATPVMSTQQLNMVPNSQGQTEHGAQLLVQHPGASAVPAHMAAHHHGGHPHPQPAHMAPHHQGTPPHTAGGGGGQMTHQPGHPTPSPVQAGGPQQMHPQHPPPSGTPQHVIFPAGPQAGQQGQPVHPNTPTSPQPMHQVSFPYSYSTTMNIPNNGSFMTIAHSQQSSTNTVHHQQHNHPSGQPQPQIVMMPQPQHQGQFGAATGQHPQLTGNPQFQTPHMQGISRTVLIPSAYGTTPVSGPGPMHQVHPMVPHSVNMAPSGIHMQYHVPHQVPSQGPQPSVQFPQHQ
ncbi:ataxin-2-like protein isoform X3 [Lingula anatina]|uniref:Ataxin-2-like protein isoform X3 n=1 Tax=Lingula anatina TaxID=7574 RepID=A0A1S3H266_LINAN|nr:ataxin-2-like protein isoform X3 [Lingula anatina]|eukprot:XP_013380037.1 ataxin-2-like protein isoform X3 [Lingula anatina]